MIPVAVKIGAAAWLAWELFHDSSAKGDTGAAGAPGAPAPVTAPPTSSPTPKPTEPAPPATKPAEPAPTCTGPELGKRWTICGAGGGPFAVTGTISRGDYDALYSSVHGYLVAVVDNTTYQSKGNLLRPVTSAWVAAMPVLAPGMPNPLGIKAASSAVQVDVTTFPVRLPGWRA